MLDAELIRLAFTALGRRLARAQPIEILIVGGAAGLLNGELKGTYTTTDVDTLKVLPPGQWDQLQDAAAKVGREMALPADWLNRDAGLFAEALPSDWESRRVDVGRFGALRVWAIGRLDLIAMKFYSHRYQDREHLAALNVTKEELKFVLQYLDALTSQADRGKLEMARHMARNWV